MSFLPTTLKYSRIVVLTQTEIDAPTASQVADYGAIYVLNVTPYTRYVTNGTSLELIAISSTTAIEQALADLSSSIGAALDLKANLDAYTRETHTGADLPNLNEQQTTSYTLALTDWGPNVTLRMNNAAANTVVLPTFATVALPIGFRIPIDQWGAGATTITTQSGVVLRSSGSNQIRGQYARVWIEKQGTNEWLLTGDTAPSGAPFNSVPPSISGGPAAGSTLTRAAGVWSGTPSPTITGQWFADGLAIGGQTGTTYATANPGDAGKSITYRESGVSTSGGPTTAPSNAIIVTAAGATKPVNSVIPSITGTAVVPNVLTASAGSWSNSPTTYKYVWKSNGTTTIRDSGFIAGATDTYTLTTAESGTTVAVTVTAHNASGDTDVPVTSLGTPVTGAAPSTGSSFPAIYAASGDYTAGTILTVDVGSWLNNPTFGYQWYRATSTSDTLTAIGTNAATYTTDNNDSEKTISCAVTGTTTGGATTVNALGVYIDVASGAPVNSVAPTISGSTPIGSTLTSTTGTWSNSPSFAYQWKRGATNVGTNSSTYATVSADGGAVMTCVVTATASSLSASATSSNSITVDSSGSGSLSGSTTSQSPFAMDSVGSVDWLLWSNSTTPETKSGGGALIGASAVGSNNASGGGLDAITWSGGTPTASGTSVGGCQNNYGVPAVGQSFTFSVGTSSRVVDIYFAGYNCIMEWAASLSDASASPINGTVDSGAAAYSGLTRLRITTNAASAAQTLTVTVLTDAADTYGGGQLQQRGAAIVS